MASHTVDLPALPPVPPPHSSIADVQLFLIEYLKFKAGMDEPTAAEKAKDLEVDGHDLFGQDEADLKTIFGIYGKGLFNHIQDSKWGRFKNLWPVAIVLGNSLSGLGAILVVFSVFHGAGSYFAMLSAGLTSLFFVVLWAVHYFCSRTSYREGKHREWLKVRLWGKPSGTRFRPGSD